MKRSLSACVSTTSRTLAIAGSLAIVTSLAGCSFTFPLAKHQQFGPPLPADAPKTQLVKRVNDNSARVISWRSTKVKISTRGPMMIPIKLDANIAVEAPRNFRLTAKSNMRGDEADFGSNDELFWFWMREGEPKCVFLARHDQMGQSEQLSMIPFKPDWLMEVLGVVPLNEEEFEMRTESSQKRQVSLTSERLSPSGQPIKRVVLVDTRYGLVLQHSLYDESGKLIARAKLSDHRPETVSGAIMPHLIQIDWPQANNVSMTMQIEEINVSPVAIASAMWELPKKPGYVPYDLGAPRTQYAQGGRGGQPVHAPGRTAENSREPEDKFVTPVTGERAHESSGRVRLDDLSEEPSEKKPAASDDNLPDWAKEPIRVAPRQPPSRRF